MKNGWRQRMKRREYARTAELRAKPEWRPCSRCGKPGAHYAPPSLGEPGFWACEVKP